MSITGTAFEWLSLFAATAVVAGVALDGLGMPFSPLLIALAALLAVASLALANRGDRRRGSDRATDLVVLAVGIAVGWHLLAPSGAALLPVGNSVDAVHHASLARYILEHGSLVRDPAAAIAVLGEMADYPPGFAILAALAAALFGTGAYAVVHALATTAVMLLACGIALLAAEGASSVARPAAAAAGLLLLLLPGYSLGIVAAENYYAQALGQWLIVACAVVAARGREAPLPLVATKLGVLLLALVLVYTTWLPIALVATGAALLARREQPLRRLFTALALIGGAAAVALLFGGARMASGSAVLLHEGSTIRDPLAETGAVLPLLAVACLPLGAIRRARWSGLGLIGGTLLLLAGFGALALRGAIAGYICYKVFYLLAVLLPLPIGWALAVVAEAIVARRPALGRSASTVGAGVALGGAIVAGACGPLPSSTASLAAHPLTPPLAHAALWLEHHHAADTMYALSRPGLPAYWVHIGLLGRARDGTAERLLREAPASFAEWYNDPAAPRFLLLESAVPPRLAGTAVRFGSSGVWVLEKTASYPEAIRRARPLLVSFRAAATEGKLELQLHLAGADEGDKLSVQLAAVSAETTLVTHTLVLLPAGRVDDQRLVFDARRWTASVQDGTSIRSDGAVADETGSNAYSMVLRLLQGQYIVAQREIAACIGASCAVEAPAGEWSYALPEQAAEAPAPLQLGLGDAIDLRGARIERSALQGGDELRLDLRWSARQHSSRQYVTFVQLIAADGGAAVSVEGEPGSSRAPTWRWQAGDTIDDEWRIPIGADIEPGTYQLVAGMYDPRTGERLQAWRRAPFVERFWTGALPLGEIAVEP